MEYKIIRSDDELMHYGVPGMKWGVRKQKYYEKKAKRNAWKEKEYRDWYGRKIKRSQKADNKLLKGREKNRQRLEKKLAKFNKDTELMKKGREIYNQIIKDRMDTRIASIYDPKTKKSFAYKNARINYAKQWITDQRYAAGNTWTKVHYADLLEKGKDPRI